MKVTDTRATLSLNNKHTYINKHKTYENNTLQNKHSEMGATTTSKGLRNYIADYVTITSHCTNYTIMSNPIYIKIESLNHNHQPYVATIQNIPKEIAKAIAILKNKGHINIKVHNI